MSKRPEKPEVLEAIVQLDAFTGRGFKLLGDRIDSLGHNANKRVDSVDQRFDAVYKRLDSIDRHFNQLEARPKNRRP
jgi:hypothetical protein